MMSASSVGSFFTLLFIDLIRQLRTRLSVLISNKWHSVMRIGSVRIVPGIWVMTLVGCGFLAPGVQGPRTDEDAVIILEHLKRKGLVLPSHVNATFIGGRDLDESPVLLFNKSAKGVRKLVVLVHGWGGDQLHTWRYLPLVFLDPAVSKEFGGRYDVALYTYPTGFADKDESLLDIASAAKEDFLQLASGLKEGVPSYEEIYFITHSMGALITQWAIISALLAQDEQELWRRFLRKVRGFVFVAAPNGRLRALIREIGQQFGIRQVNEIGYGRFREDLEKKWIEAEKRSYVEFRRLFRMNTRLVLATGDAIVDNATIRDRFTELDPVPIYGGHVSVVKVEGDTDPLVSRVIRRFLTDRMASGEGLEIRPQTLDFLVPDERPCDVLTIKNKDRTLINWWVDSRPLGFSLSENRALMESEEAKELWVYRTSETRAASVMHISWRYGESGPLGTAIPIALREVPVSGVPRRTEAEDRCTQKVKVMRLFERKDFWGAYLALREAGGQIAELRQSPTFSKLAGFVFLKVGRPAETLKWWSDYAAKDDVGKIYLAAALSAYGEISKARTVVRWMKAPIELGSEEVKEIQSELPEMALEKAGLAVLPARGFLFKEPVKVVKASAHASLSFDADKFTVSHSDFQQLKNFASGVQKTDFGVVLVRGYAADRGTAEYNLALAERRATEVSNILKQLGIDPSRIRVQWREAVPVGPWPTAGELARQVSVLAVQKP